MGGAEHATGHLLFSRFITKALADHPDVHLPFREPFTQFRSVGLILGENGEKMSKSRGNVLNPDEIIARYGADAFRIYEMFMGPFAEAKPWSTDGLIGSRRFIERIATLFSAQVNTPDKMRTQPSSSIHACIKKVEHDIINFNFNTAISAMMIFMNSDDWRSTLKPDGTWSGDGWDQKAAENFLVLLHPFAPHLAEHCWQLLGHTKSIQVASWPTLDVVLAAGDTVTIAVQVNGKLRASLNMVRGTSDKELERLALNHEAVKKYLQDVKVQRVVVVKDKVVSIVTSAVRSEIASPELNSGSQ